MGIYPKGFPDAVRELADHPIRTVTITTPLTSTFKKGGLFVLEVLVPEVNIVSGVPYLVGVVHTDFMASAIKRGLEQAVKQYGRPTLTQLITGVFLSIRDKVDFNPQQVKPAVENSAALISLRYEPEVLDLVRSEPYGKKLKAWINGESVHTAEFTHVIPKDKEMQRASAD